MLHANAISLKQLRALAAIVETGSLVAAAQRLNVTAPAISTQLKLLEANVGARLLERGDGQVTLTEPGRELLSAAQQIETTLGRCVRRVEALQAGLAGHVALGVVSTGKYFAPRLVAQARKALPEVEIGLHIGNRSAIIAAIAEGRVDLAIMGRPPRSPAVVAHPLGDHPHIFIASPDHPLAGVPEIAPDVLLEELFLMREQGSGTRILTERFLDQYGDGRLYERLEFSSNETIKQAVMGGLGIAMLSAHTVVAELEHGRLVRLDVPGTPIVRKWFVTYPETAPLTPAAERFVEFLLSLEGSFLPDMAAAAA